MTTPAQVADGQLAALELHAAAATDAAVDQAVQRHGLAVAALAAAVPVLTLAVARAVAQAVRVGAALAVAAARGVRRLRAVRSARRAVTGIDVAGRVRDVVSASTVALGRLAHDDERRAEVDRMKGRLRSMASTAVNEGASAGTEAAARQLGAAGLMWVAERNACLTCQALSGHVAAIGQRFPAGVTFADKPLRWRKFTGRPPRHPNCRCRTVPVFGEGSAQATVLRREARRSIVRGFSLPSESEPARLRAAERLLAGARPGVPRSVAAYGRQAVLGGRFPRGRAIRSAGRRTK